VAWELFDRRETQWWLCSAQRWESDVVRGRERYWLLKDAPRLWEASRFPDYDAARSAVEFNRAYQAELERRLPWESDREALIRQALREAEYLREVWAAARDANTEYCYITTKREALADLRRLLGEEDFATGDMPPPAPFWRFNKIGFRQLPPGKDK
jgi:hypothetical protein